MKIETRVQQIKLLVLDVDGVLTSGQIIIGPDGEALKTFHAQDGLGISAAHRVGLKTAIITGRESRMVSIRGEELKIADIYQGTTDKLTTLCELASKYGLALDEICYVGDDLNDLPVILRVGLACAVANAVAEVKAAAHYVATREGGAGAVREVIEMILKIQGKWNDVVAAYQFPAKIELPQ